MIKKEVLKNGQEVMIKECTVQDIDSFISLQDEVIESLTDTSFFQSLSQEEYAYILNGNGRIIGAYANDELIAFRALLIPDVDESEHLGRDAGLETEVLNEVIYSEISSVKPSFRGNRLQKILGEVLLAQIDTKQFRYICATVAPFNIASLLDKFSHGLQIVALKEKYEGVLRYIFFKDLQTQHNEEKASLMVKMEKIAEQQALLDKGWRGVGIVEREGTWFVNYQQFG